MNRISISICLLLLAAATMAQTQSGMLCRLGFEYEMSMSNNWGKGKPVVMSVVPYTPAEQAGIKVNDVIEAIDGIALADVRPEDIPQMLNPLEKNEVVLTISNMGNKEKQILIRKDCKRGNAITEDQLAVAFSMYSLESTNEREFVCPFKAIVTNDPVDFARFATYGFSAVDENNVELETVINDQIAIELSRKGMMQDNVSPDILIQTFYFFDKNPNYKGANKVQVKRDPIYRYNITRNVIERFPFHNYNAAESEAEYLMQLGVRFVDQKEQAGRILWECEANELLEESYRLDDYARVHIPLMLMQYPYVKYSRNVPYRVTKKTYNYTGIQYNIDKLELVADVDRNSPAYAAGVRPGDQIERIGKQRMNKTAEEFTRGYKRFISTTMQYRDPKTQFVDANGFDHCMYWDVFSYPKVAETLQKNEYIAAFSYLYNFAPYINPSGNNTCTFEIKRGKNKQEIIIRPTIRTELVVEIK